MEKDNNAKIIISILVALLVISVMVIIYLLSTSKAETAKVQETKTSNSNSTNMPSSNYGNSTVGLNSTNTAISNYENNTTVGLNSTTSNTSNIANDENKYDKLKGEYQCKSTDEEGRIVYCFTLSLADDGTFNYILVDNASPIVYNGNYIINGSEIILNKLFFGGGDVGCTVTSGQIKLKINRDGTISDTNKYKKFEKLNITNVTLKKETEKVNSDLRVDIKNAIKNNAISAGE